jgi:hypothetical protein
MAVSAVGLGLAIDALGFSTGALVFVLTSSVYGLALLWLARRFARHGDELVPWWLVVLGLGWQAGCFLF